MTSSQYGISSPPPFSDRKLSSSELHHNHHYEYVSMDASSSSSSLSPSMKLERSFSATPTSDSQMRCNKRSKFSPYGLNGSHHHNHPPVAARRNERERNRVKLVNMGFSTLRQHVPNGAKNKKMSKVETLRSAVDYIRQLQQLLGEGSENIRTTNENLESSSPLSSTSSGAGSSLDPYQLTHQQVSSSSSPSGHETSSPISSTTHSPSYDSSEVSFQDRERCSISNSLHQLHSNNNNASFSASDEDIISFSKWFS